MSISEPEDFSERGEENERQEVQFLPAGGLEHTKILSLNAHRWSRIGQTHSFEQYGLRTEMREGMRGKT